MTLCINKILRANPRGGRYGAPMGAHNFDRSSAPLHVQRVRFVDGGYAPDGTYWGAGLPLYCAFNGSDCAEFAPAHGSRIYVRAKTREEAKRLILEAHDVEFKK